MIPKLPGGVNKGIRVAIRGRSLPSAGCRCAISFTAQTCRPVQSLPTGCPSIQPPCCKVSALPQPGSCSSKN
ncbi:hypothetical protein AcV7_003794 [Taiwanofungus camphoratus]|nr:hypothetical protein AcV7_003794 [Antrodia cinnamomea]